MASVFKVWMILGIWVVVSYAQPPANIYAALQPNGCGQFLAILNQCSEFLRRQYQENMAWTVFAPNDTAFNNLPPSKLSALLSMNVQESERFVQSFTLRRAILTTYFQEREPEQTQSSRVTYIFFKKKPRRVGNSASGVAGPDEYYANGAMIWKPNIQAGQSLIHVIDRVLELPSDKSIFGYISLEGQPDTAFANQILKIITGPNYQKTIEPLNTYKYLTVFVPTQAALAKIPREKMNILLSNPEKLNTVVRQHMVQDQVIYTSFVYHNEGYISMGLGQVIFRTSIAREAVYVYSGKVTAQITQGNITCTNGAVHFVDTLLGFIYNSAQEEIAVNDQTQIFEQILEMARNDLQNIIVSASGVTLFVPINSAFSSLPSFYNYRTNQSLVNKIIELSLLEHGQENSVTNVNGDYEARETWTSQFFRRPISVYSQGNESWIESGYVKARVVRPDIGVTNGIVHFIDAVPGAPSRDIPNTIFCEDWLIKSSWQLKLTGLNNYMRDLRVDKLAPCTLSGGVRVSPDVFSGQASPAGSVCPGNCQFTIFIPNGTAIDFFENQEAGKFIQQNPDRWRYVLQRHITRQVIYMDQTAIGQERSFIALNGNQVRFRRVTERYSYIFYQGAQATVLHSDLGGTNGVVHIIDRVIYVRDDLYMNTSGSIKPVISVLWLCAIIISHATLASVH